MRTLLVIFLCFVDTRLNVECLPLRGYVLNKLSGLEYRIMYQSQSWPVARDKCQEEGGKLAVPESMDDFHFIQKLVRAMYYPDVVDTNYKLLVWLGINNLDDYRVWKTVDGADLNQTTFHTWADGNGIGYSNDEAEPHCAGIDPVNHGLRDYWCHRRQPYVCQRQHYTP